MPVDIDPTNVAVRADGAIGLGYTYKAAGQASGDVPGSFTYEEHGYLFFSNPADPTTYVGGRYDSGVLTLQPQNQNGQPPLVVADTNPAAYQASQRTAPVPQLDTLLRSYGNNVLSQLGLTPVAGSVHYGSFTFTDAYGTFWGVSTPDSRHFLLHASFPTDQGQASQPGHNGAGFGGGDRFSH